MVVMASPSSQLSTFEERRKHIMDKDINFNRPAPPLRPSGVSGGRDTNGEKIIIPLKGEHHVTSEKGVGNIGHKDDIEGNKASGGASKAPYPHVSSKIGKMQNNLHIDPFSLLPPSPTSQDEATPTNETLKPVNPITKKLSSVSASTRSGTPNKNLLPKFPPSNTPKDTIAQKNSIESPKTTTPHSVKSGGDVLKKISQGREDVKHEPLKLLSAPTMSRPKASAKRRPPKTSFVPSIEVVKEDPVNLVLHTIDTSSLLPSDHLFANVIGKSISQPKKSEITTRVPSPKPSLHSPVGAFKMSPTMLAKGQTNLKRVKDSPSPPTVPTTSSSRDVLSYVKLNRNNNNSNQSVNQITAKITYPNQPGGSVSKSLYNNELKCELDKLLPAHPTLNRPKFNAKRRPPNTFVPSVLIAKEDNRDCIAPTIDSSSLLPSDHLLSNVIAHSYGHLTSNVLLNRIDHDSHKNFEQSDYVTSDSFSHVPVQSPPSPNYSVTGLIADTVSEKKLLEVQNGLGQFWEPPRDYTPSVDYEDEEEPCSVPVRRPHDIHFKCNGIDGSNTSFLQPLLTPTNAPMQVSMFDSNFLFKPSLPPQFTAQPLSPGSIIKADAGVVNDISDYNNCCLSDEPFTPLDTNPASDVTMSETTICPNPNANVNRLTKHFNSLASDISFIDD